MNLPLSPSSQKLIVVLINISNESRLYFKFFYLEFQISSIFSFSYFRGMAQPAAATRYMQITPPTATPTTANQPQ
jgi:hypothetical protein